MLLFRIFFDKRGAWKALFFLSGGGAQKVRYVVIAKKLGQRQANYGENGGQSIWSADQSQPQKQLAKADNFLGLIWIFFG